jgi:hypothetical protein
MNACNHDGADVNRYHFLHDTNFNVVAMTDGTYNVLNVVERTGGTDIQLHICVPLAPPVNGSTSRSDGADRHNASGR